jgi:hypothetical protein
MSERNGERIILGIERMNPGGRFAVSQDLKEENDLLQD